MGYRREYLINILLLTCLLASVTTHVLSCTQLNWHWKCHCLSPLQLSRFHSIMRSLVVELLSWGSNDYTVPVHQGFGDSEYQGVCWGLVSAKKWIRKGTQSVGFPDFLQLGLGNAFDPAWASSEGNPAVQSTFWILVSEVFIPHLIWEVPPEWPGLTDFFRKQVQSYQRSGYIPISISDFKMSFKFLHCLLNCLWVKMASLRYLLDVQLSLHVGPLPIGKGVVSDSVAWHQILVLKLDCSNGRGGA